eukprot:scaffold366749_cov20-Prasinocladus_malaysianus.AAC.1
MMCIWLSWTKHGRALSLAHHQLATTPRNAAAAASSSSRYAGLLEQAALARTKQAPSADVLYGTPSVVTSRARAVVLAA